MTPHEQPAYISIPSNLIPDPSLWELPAGSELPNSNVDLSKLETFEGESLWIGIGAPVKDLVAKKLPQLSQVRNLSLDGYLISQSILDGLGNLTGLRRLGISNIRATSFDFLAGLENLEYLSIEGAPNAKDLEPIIRCNSLVSLGVGTSVSSLGAFRPGALPNLRCLVLGGTSESRPARFDTLEPLKNLSRLEYLSPLNCRATDRSLQFISEMPNIRGLHVGDKKWWRASDIQRIEESGVHLTSVS